MKAGRGARNNPATHLSYSKDFSALPQSKIFKQEGKSRYSIFFPPFGFKKYQESTNKTTRFGETMIIAKCYFTSLSSTSHWQLRISKYPAVPGPFASLTTLDETNEL